MFGSFERKNTPHPQLPSLNGIVFAGSAQDLDNALTTLANDPKKSQIIAEALSEAIAWAEPEKAKLLVPHLDGTDARNLFVEAIDRAWMNDKGQEDKSKSLAIVRLLAEVVSQSDKDDLLRINALGLRPKELAGTNLALPQQTRVRYLVAAGADIHKPLIPADVQYHLENIGAFVSHDGSRFSDSFSIKQFALLLEQNRQFNLDGELFFARILKDEMNGPSSGYRQIANAVPANAPGAPPSNMTPTA